MTALGSGEIEAGEGQESLLKAARGLGYASMESQDKAIPCKDLQHLLLPSSHL